MIAGDALIERIGLLFVHGIGEQKRFEHLTASVSQIAELMERSDPRARVSVVDRTDGWTQPPGDPHPLGLAPMTLSVRSPDTQIDFECYEVWWADLGSRSGVWDVISFWIWGLGQWCAPIYREIDASRLDKDDTESSEKPTSSLVKLPKGIVGDMAQEPWARFKLLLAGVAAAFAAVTWSLAKRLAGALLGQAPSPTLIVQYVGDVRTYTEAGGPGLGTPTDPGQPRRVGIRRRMVSEMVAVATQPLDGWYVLAHSQGTVVAYNGLTEIGHTLPNYLSEAQWRGLPAALTHDPGCAIRRDIENMMPSRPPWLADGDVINRPAMFANLRGLLTYGSPLGKYAALWPRIVATATDRVNKNDTTFPSGCRWINFAAPQDPVAGMFSSSFPTGHDDFLHNAIPPVEDVRTPLGPDLVLAHIRYLAGYERYARGTRVVQSSLLMRWLLGDQPSFAPPAPGRSADAYRIAALAFGYLFLVWLLWMAAVLVFTGLRAGSWAIGSSTSAPWCEAVLRFLLAAAHGAGPVLGTALSMITLCGLWRWFRESRHNLLLAQADRDDDPGNLAAYWAKVIGMVRWHWRLGGAFFVGALVTCAGASILDWRHAFAADPPTPCHCAELRGVLRYLLGPASEGRYGNRIMLAAMEDFRASATALTAAIFAACSQAFINWTFKPARPRQKPTAS